MDLTALDREALPEAAPVVDIVIPVYNEEDDLGRSVCRLDRYLRERFPFTARITIVDNASTDRTWAIARALERELRGVRAIHLPRKGRGGALAAAWLDSDALVVAYMDVDLSTDLDALLPLVAPLVSGHSDIAIGSRLAPGARVVRSPEREVISRCYNMLLRLALHVRFSDAQCGFKAVRTDVARRLVPRTESREWFFDTELLVLGEREGLRIHEVPVDWIEGPDSRVDIPTTVMEDLRGIMRLSRPTLHQLGPFALIGAGCTVAYALLYLLLRPFTSPEIANAVALIATAVAGTAANRRLTFGVQGRSGLAIDHAGGLAALGVSLVITSLSAAALSALRPNPGPEVELAVLLVANAIATLVRFVLLRAVIHERRQPPPAMVAVPRRHP